MGWEGVGEICGTGYRECTPTNQGRRTQVNILDRWRVMGTRASVTYRCWCTTHDVEQTKVSLSYISENMFLFIVPTRSDYACMVEDEPM